MYICLHIEAYMFTYRKVCIYDCIQKCTYMYSIYVYVCVYVYVYVYVYIYIYIYIYIYYASASRAREPSVCTSCTGWTTMKNCHCQRFKIDVVAITELRHEHKAPETKTAN